MFESLIEKLNSVFKRLKDRGKLNESDVNEALKEIRISLLEADVNYKVVKEFINSVKERAIGKEVLESLTPGHQVVKIVNEELIRLMGSTNSALNLSGPFPISIMLVGLHGSGKTTTAGKLAKLLKDKRYKPYLVAADIYRPAATDQLKKLGDYLDVDVYIPQNESNPVDICINAKRYGENNGYNLLIIDTAGRLHIDEPLMEELKSIKNTIVPKEILLVADAMTGQEAVNVASRFNDVLDITGVILTKMEGDARGGAALSIRAVTGKPIKFIGIGEKLDALESFYPDRMASRILGMGDIISFIEKAEEAYDERKSKELERKIRKNEFTLEDFKEQIQQIKNMGSIEELIGMIPGFNKIPNVNVDPSRLKRIDAIINSMTKKERLNHTIINGSRRKRIARGSGTSVQEVNRLLKEYIAIKKMIPKLNKRGFKSLFKGLF
jgi:signal recognition particle subunit SRP54